MLNDKLESNTENAIVSKNKKHFFKSKRNVVISVVVLVLALISVYLIINNFRSDNTDTASSGVCSGEILDESVAVLVPLDLSKASELDALVKKITVIEDYDKDPNCLYPVMQDSVFKGDLQKSIETFSLLESIYGDGSLFASNRYNITIDFLRSNAELYKRQIESINTGNSTQSFGSSKPSDSNQSEQ